MKRTLAYTRVRRRRTKPRAPRGERAPTGEDLTILFHSGAAEFPVAILRPHDPGAHARALAGEFARWLVAKWAWLRPRTVPVMVAVLGLLAVLASADYLRNLKGTPPHPPSHPSMQMQSAK